MAIVETYRCDDCGMCSCQGADEGLPDGWQTNVDDCAFCPSCLARRPLDAHECDNDMCCYGRTSSVRAGGLDVR
jgi:hypothetical protein